MPVSSKLTSTGLLILMLALASGASGQEPEDKSSRPRRWSFAAYLGFSSSGPNQAIERLLSDGGFNDNDGLQSGTGTDHPYSLTGIDFQNGTPWMLAGSYAFLPSLAGTLLFADTRIGTTFGFTGSPPQYLDIKYHLISVAALASWQYKDLIRVGLGPALHSPKVTLAGFRAENNSDISAKVGLIADLSISFPSKTPFFGELRIQYRRVGDVEIGPFSKEALNFSRTLPATTVSYDHWFFAVGIGFGT